MKQKHSVAVLIRRDNHILTLRRPDDDDELPGVWGLPAGTFRAAETLAELVRRIGKDKLGVTLSPLRKLGDGDRGRTTYRLHMELWEAAMDGVPTRAEWKWADPAVLLPGRERGSLCCDLALQALRADTHDAG